ncbi:hypothetical protein, partial [Bacillus cereus]|uniref:hypothetical protein n=1 Tax=Bacillus cereus TaxID=1396 RepID=UPI001C12ACFF
DSSRCNHLKNNIIYFSSRISRKKGSFSLKKALLTGIDFFITRTNKLIITYTVLSLKQDIIFSEQGNH